LDFPARGGLLAQKKNWVLEDLLSNLDKAYQENIGVEFMHLPNIEECDWIRNRFEFLPQNPISNEKRIRNFDRFMWGIKFAKFIS